MEDVSTRTPATGIRRAVFLGLGIVFTAIGVIGAFVPLLPTTIFLIIATACFARSSERLERRLLDHPRFGPPVRRWRERGAISPTGKTMALSGMAAGLTIFLLTARHNLALVLVAAAVIGGCALFVATRPSA